MKIGDGYSISLTLKLSESKTHKHLHISTTHLQNSKVQHKKTDPDDSDRGCTECEAGYDRCVSSSKQSAHETSLLHQRRSAGLVFNALVGTISLHLLHVAGPAITLLFHRLLLLFLLLLLNYARLQNFGNPPSGDDGQS